LGGDARTPACLCFNTIKIPLAEYQKHHLRLTHTMPKQAPKKPNRSPSVAIIGGGVSGLSLAYFLQSKNIEFVLFEKEGRLGGNAHTRKIVHNDKARWVDMAVNDFNPSTYTMLSTLMGETNSAAGQVKVNTTFFSPSRFLFKESEVTDAEILENISRLKKEALEVLSDEMFRSYSVRDYFDAKGYAPKFLSQYLYPRIQGLFFYPPAGFQNLPVYFVMQFYALQCGFKQQEMSSETRFNFNKGASSWIANLVKAIPAQNIIQSESPKIARTENGFEIRYAQQVLSVEKLVFACHADDLCQHYAAVLCEQQCRILSTVKYAKMLSVAHCDIKYLPVESTDFSAYNCLVKDAACDKNTDYTITYNCNEHQNLSNGGNNTEGASDCFFVTVNPTQKIEDQYILRDTDGQPLIKEFSRNICDFDLLKVQEQLEGQQGKNNVYFVGGYTNGIGLHENCLVQSAGVANKIGSAFQILSKPLNVQPIYKGGHY
jgi:uncharacterized protein